ncbi:MAG: hypothetical protein JJU33_00295 [Phycisphaerales bacterium]|nr:hypothetical protein [Phycisphaerales bacterium]
MGSLKKWQIAVLALAPIVLGVSIFFSLGRGQVRTADTVVLVDLMSGDRFIFSTAGRRTIAIPAEHPDTGEQTLVPVSQNDNGVWHADRRFIGTLRDHARTQEEMRRQLRSAGRTPPEKDNLETLYERLRNSEVIDLESARIRVTETAPRRVR